MYYFKTKQTLFRSVLATLIFATAFFVACSSEEEQTINNELNLMHRPSGVVSLDLEEKVTSFYGDNVTFTTGRTASTRVNGVYYYCTELIINSDTRARGYIFSEQLTENFLYIAYVDRINYVLRTYDFINNESYSISEINNHLDYENSNGLDFIEITNNSEKKQTYRRPIFGESTTYEYTPCGVCTCVWEVSTVYIFWIKFQSKEMVNLTNCNVF